MALVWNTNAKNTLTKFSSYFIIAKYPDEIFKILSDICNGRVPFPEKFKKPSGITYFLSLQGKLSNEERMSLLQKVLSCEITIAQMRDRATTMKLENAIKESFCDISGLKDWNAALKKYPAILNSTWITGWVVEFKNARFEDKNNIPNSFKEAVKNLISTNTTFVSSQSEHLTNKITYKRCNYWFYNMDLLSLGNIGWIKFHPDLAEFSFL